MISENKNIKRENGIYYSPESLATLLCKGFDFSKIKTALDPACGDGALLSAVILESKRQGKRLQSLVGCDVFFQDLSEISEKITFQLGDFLSYDCHDRFDMIVMNPPYVSYGEISPATRGIIETIKNRFSVSGRADLWVYFLLKSFDLLAKGASLGAILPWAFNEAEYAKPIRELILSSFGEIKLTVLNQSHFAHTDTRTLLLWAKKYSFPNKLIRVGFSDFHDTRTRHERISQKTWIADSIFHSVLSGMDCGFRTLQEKGFVPFSECAKVETGVVTGANSFFILPPKDAEKIGFSCKYQTPILTTGLEITSLEQKNFGKVLINFGKSISKKQKAYITFGKKDNIHQRTHSKRRELWYQVQHGVTPDAFFTYRVGSIPLMVLNGHKLLCTNSFHKIYFFDHINENQKKWIQISMLSIFGQMCIEINARHYGHGMVKLEPKLLKKVLCLPLNCEVPTDMYKQMCHLVKEKKREQVCMLATQLIQKELRLPSSFVQTCLDTVNVLRKRRGYPVLAFEL